MESNMKSWHFLTNGDEVGCLGRLFIIKNDTRALVIPMKKLKGWGWKYTSGCFDVVGMSVSSARTKYKLIKDFQGYSDIRDTTKLSNAHVEDLLLDWEYLAV